MKGAKFYNWALYIAVLLLFILFSFPSVYAFADEDGDYRFTVKKYDVVYDINADRSMQVSEEITILYQGYDSTGFIRDIPVNAGDRVKNISVSEIIGGIKSAVDYEVYIEYSEFVSIDIGDYSKKLGETHTYLIQYDYLITKPTNKDAIYLNAIGYGWESDIYDASVTINLPDGFIAEHTRFYIGNSNFTSHDYTVDGNTVTASVPHLYNYKGLTFDFYFKKGSLTVITDFTPYFILIGGVILLGIFIILRLLVFKEKPLTPVVNFTAPDDMDPLVMGKYIDNTVNSEDITSLIYYWASKGFLKINLDDEKDPVLIKVYNALPQGSPEHQVIMYNNLFKQGEVVKISSLENKFYTTVEAVTHKVNSSVKGFYTNTSTFLSLLFATLGGLFISLIPLSLAFVNLSGYFYWQSFIALVPTYIIYGVCLIALNYKQKLSKAKRLLFYLGAVLIGALGTVACCFALSPATIETPALITSCIVGYLLAMLSISVMQRTDAYTQKLNHIIGFKNFILYTEKNRLEAMIEQDPQFYYHILPYAQVLGVTDAWADKFKGITVAPPAWMVSDRDLITTYFEVRIINRALRHASYNMTKNMISRPSSSGSSGGGVGRFGGGGGFGHGGGGGRGR
ncbi:MAG: DUF2207 domain-containing protein [Clostridiales bacterium]|nr:DUF2207 domain-containing protein [Clostridiales bacterium]